MANERVVPKSNEYKEYYIPLKRAERQIHPGVFIFFYFLSLSLTIINQSFRSLDFEIVANIEHGRKA